MLLQEWGCRFMVVVKNLPPVLGVLELSELFEAAGEIFTIKVLNGNRGEPYALVRVSGTFAVVAMRALVGVCKPFGGCCTH